MCGLEVIVGERRYGGVGKICRQAQSKTRRRHPSANRTEGQVFVRQERMKFCLNYYITFIIV